MKKNIVVAAVALCAIAIVCGAAYMGGCFFSNSNGVKLESSSVDPMEGANPGASMGNVTLNEGEMRKALENLATELDKSNGADGVELRVNEDGCCMVTVSAEDGTENELNSADSVKALFELYLTGGFLDEKGNVTGAIVVPEDEIAEPTPTPNPNSASAEDIIARNELDGEDTMIAGFPGEGMLDAGAHEPSSEGTSSNVTGTADSVIQNEVVENGTEISAPENGG